MFNTVILLVLACLYRYSNSVRHCLLCVETNSSFEKWSARNTWKFVYSRYHVNCKNTFSYYQKIIPNDYGKMHAKYCISFLLRSITLLMHCLFPFQRNTRWCAIWNGARKWCSCNGNAFQLCRSSDNFPLLCLGYDFSFGFILILYFKRW